MAAVWLVPLAATVGARIYLYGYEQERRAGDLRDVLPDGTGIRPGDTKVMYRGVEVGSVEEVALGPDHQRVVKVSARLHRCGWRPRAGGDDVLGRSAEDFDDGRFGIEHDPERAVYRPVAGRLGEGDAIHRAGSAAAASGAGAEHRGQGGGEDPVQLQIALAGADFLPGSQIGSVRSVKLADDADAVMLTVLIQPRYAKLVRTTSIFWLVKGIDLKGGDRLHRRCR